MIWCCQEVHQHPHEPYRSHSSLWLLCMLYVCHLLNATASPALGGLTPLQALTGQVPDISHFLHFSYWEPSYYKG